MTIGKVVKKDSRPPKYKFMKKKTNNLTLKDFAELIEFMNETDDGPNNLSRPAPGFRADNRPVLGLGHYLSQPSRLNNQVPSSDIPRQGVVIEKRNNLFSSTGPAKKKENNEDRNPLDPTGNRQSMEMQ